MQYVNTYEYLGKLNFELEFFLEFLNNFPVSFKWQDL